MPSLVEQESTFYVYSCPGPTVVNHFSLSGQRVGKSHFYSATKYAVTALTEGIRWELRGINSHIRISVSDDLQSFYLLGQESCLV